MISVLLDRRSRVVSKYAYLVMGDIYVVLDAF